jgi:hypothetical protein
MNKKSDPLLLLSVLFLIYAVWANTSGWVLSWLSNLNIKGYIAALIPLFYLFYKVCRSYLSHNFTLRKSIRKLRWSEISWIVVLAVIIAGALLNRPFGWDACAYRLPRVLRWLESNNWCWLNSADDRQDISALAFEWMIAPLYAIFKNDRPLFLINLIPYICMPRLCWLGSRATGINRQWALASSYLIPLGFCFSLQAGGVQNDGIASFFALMPIALLNAQCAPWLSKKWKFGISILSICILSGLKLTNLPLAGIIFIWIIWNYRGDILLYFTDIKWGAIMVVLSFLSSVLPISLANIRFTGHWSGDPGNVYRHKANDPLTAVYANALFCLCDAVSPNPLANRINEFVKGSELLDRHLNKIGQVHPNIKYLKFSSYGYEGQSGASTPIMVGISILWCIGLIFFLKKSRFQFTQFWFLILVSIAYLTFLSNIAVHGSQRHAAAYYPLLVIGMLACSTANFRLLPDKIVQGVIICCSIVTTVTLFLSPVRPLLPQSICDRLDQKGASFQLHQDALHQGELLRRVPAQNVFCVTQWGAITHQMWKPYFRGEMIEINSSSFEPQMLQGRGLIYVTELGVTKRYGLSLEQFFLVLGTHQIIGRESVKDPRSFSSNGILIMVDNLSNIPLTNSNRLYPSS